jgi:hypothetical protein
MKKKKIPDKIKEVDLAVNYLAEILVEAFLDKQVKENPEFKDPRINKPIYDLINESKKRRKN